MKRIYTFPALLLSLAIAAPASAHNTAGRLSQSPSADGRFSVTCSGGNSSTRMVAAIQGFLPKNAATLSVTVSKDGVQTSPSTDAKNGDGKYSPEVTLSGGEGVYMFLIRKAKGNSSAFKKAVTYDVQYHCLTGSEHTYTGDPIWYR